MTVPTEKQIEAAAEAVWNRLGSDYTWAEAKALNDGQAEWAIEDARVALSAALAVEAGAGLSVDALAQEIRRVDGNHSLGAGALAEALMPFLRSHPAPTPAGDDMQAAVDRWADALRKCETENTRSAGHALDAAEETLLYFASPAPHQEGRADG